MRLVQFAETEPDDKNLYCQKKLTTLSGDYMILLVRREQQRNKVIDNMVMVTTAADDVRLGSVKCHVCATQCLVSNVTYVWYTHFFLNSRGK
jgi:hypothetical protein